MFEKKYKIGDLHIVWLGKAKVSGETTTLISLEKIYQYRIVKDYHHSHYRDEETCIDVLNDTKYERISYASHAGGVYFEYARPLSAILPFQKAITEYELQEVFFRINGVNIKNEQQEDKIEDSTIKLILTTTDKINTLDLSNEKRTEILTTLKTLAEYYISTLITLKSQGQNPTTLSSPITELELECKNKIAEIELSLNDVEKTENLKKQLVMVKQRLK